MGILDRLDAWWNGDEPRGTSLRNPLREPRPWEQESADLFESTELDIDTIRKGTEREQ